MIRLGIEKDINEALLKDIMAIYADAEDKMLKAVAKRVAKGIKTEGWNEQKLQETQKLNKELAKLIGDVKKLSNSKVSQGIIEAYKQGKLEVGDKGIHETILDELEIPMNLKMQVLAANNLLNNASFQVLRNANDAYQKIMANATTGLLAGTDTRIQATQKMLNEFASKGITTFVDKAGRNWSLASYAEMCTRTVTAHAALQGHIDRQLEVGEDLVKVSSIGTTCPICMRWQGVVLSISGNSPKYHSVDEAKAAGLFHPNCKHTLGMYIPELDDGTEHEGKVEPMSQEEANKQYGVQRNKLIEKQRANERMIRYWKNRKALAITPEEKAKCDEKIKAWQYKNLIHCEKNGLRRQYAREGVMVGNPEGAMGTLIGGSLKEYEEVFEKVIGDDPKKAHKTFMKMKLTLFSEKKSYEKWLREEITSLDDIDVDRAMMKDASCKTVTPTSLYKKYIGDSPMKDYAEISIYEKGTKEFKSHYAKWLKQQIEEIGVSYKVKPKYTEVHEDIPEEDKKLSATEIYKKYHDGEKPTEAYKKLGGEEGTGMKYGKWVETQKKELIKRGITKTVSFESSTIKKTTDTIKTATKTVEKAKTFVDDAVLKDFEKEVKEITDPKHMSTKMKDMSSKIGSASGHEKEILEKKYKMLKERDLEILREKAKTSTKTDAEYEMKWLKDHVLDSKTIPDDVKAHVKKKYDVWEKRKIEIEAEEEAKRKKAEEKKRVEMSIEHYKSMFSTYTKSEIEEFKTSPWSKKDPDYDIKLKAIAELEEEKKKEATKRKADKKRLEELEKRKKELDKVHSKGGYIPRDAGASVLDGLNEHLESSPTKGRVKSRLKEIATELGVSEEEAKLEVDNDLKEIFNECEFGARIKGNVLEMVLSDDPSQSGFKNLFEVGTGGGCTNKKSRSSGENEVFGYKGDNADWENNAKDRPFYGMMMPKYEKGNFSEHYYKKGPGRWYGDGITLTFDKSIASNVSFTLGDSLDYKHSVVGCEATNPEFRGCHGGFVDDYVSEKKKGTTDPDLLLTKIASDGDRYLELQYHGHQTKNDMVNLIKHVYIEEDYYNKSKITELLDKKGISYTFI